MPILLFKFSKMASDRASYTADDFRKEKVLLTETKPNDEDKESNQSSSSSEEDEDSRASSRRSLEAKFQQEDKLISRLYREVVDSIMNQHRLQEKCVQTAIDEMKEEIYLAHKKGFRNSREIHFGEPAKCCAYLRRYAICHTSLVKKVIWEFFTRKDISGIAKEVREEITKQNHLRIIGLGGGPGNDFVGFCSALQEIPNSVEKLDLTIVDQNESWETVFPSILQKASGRTDYGSFGKCVKEKKISTGFMAADLTADGIFEDEDLSTTLEDVDIVLMVKLASFLPDKETVKLIENVVNSMQPEAKLIFIDQPYDRAFFRQISDLLFIYEDSTIYKLSYKPRQFQSPSIASAQAHLAIFQKTTSLSEEDSSDHWQ